MVDEEILKVYALQWGVEVYFSNLNFLIFSLFPSLFIFFFTDIFGSPISGLLFMHSPTVSIYIIERGNQKNAIAFAVD
jgi:hypothetical protein